MDMFLHRHLTAHYRTIHSFLSIPNTSNWNSTIKSHIDSSRYDAALSLFSSMLASPARPELFTVPLAVRAVSALGDRLYLGEALHCIGIRIGLAGDLYFSNTIIDMYVKHDRLTSAHKLFDEMPDRDVVSWTSLISGYVHTGDIYESFQLFSSMRWAGAEPSPVTLAIFLKGSSVGELRQLYCFAIKKGHDKCELVQNSILTAFVKVGNVEDVDRLFYSVESRSIIMWNVLMSGYSSQGFYPKVVSCFEKLRGEVDPSCEALTLVISALTKLGDLIQGQKLHGLAFKLGQMDSVLESSLVDFYAKCGELASSTLLFEQVRLKNGVCWSIMIRGHIQNGQFWDAITLCRRMVDSGFEQSADTLRGLVIACTELGVLHLGIGVHGYLIKHYYFCNIFDVEALETSIVNMYAKCGNIVLARRCFDKMMHKDIIAWSSMIEAYAIYGLGSEALELFHRMQEEGVEPNRITFLSLLSACSHSGLVSEGCDVFDSMSTRFGIEPELNHYTCMVDLLGRSGKLYEALNVIYGMNCEPDARIWGALLASCRIHADWTLGNYVAQRLFNLESDNVGYHVVLSNVQVGESKWEEAEKIRKDVSRSLYRKKPGWSCIEEKGGFFMFVSGDRSHTQSVEIYRILLHLIGQIGKTGAVLS